jgi:hypothetical protein
MFATDDFVFVHIPKTGGNYMRGLFLGQIRFDSEHLPWARLPEELRGLPATCTVRNPWEWFVSWYAFALLVRPGNDPNWPALMDSGRASFGEFLRRTFDDPYGDIYSRAVRDLCGSGLETGEIRPLRLEHLREELPRFLAQLGAEPPEFSSLRRNVSVHAPYRDYYSPATRKLVAGCPLVERFGYEF